jgi:hypothetical protein
MPALRFFGEAAPRSPTFRAKLRDAPGQFHRDRLGVRKSDRTLIDLLRCKFVPERCHERPASGIKRIVFFPPSEIEHCPAMEFVCGDLIRDYIVGSGQYLPYGAPNKPEYGTYPIKLRGNILVCGFDSGFGHCDFSRSTDYSEFGKRPSWIDDCAAGNS